MIFLVNAENRGQFATDLHDMYSQRSVVSINREANWTVPMAGDSQIDEYDREETVYLLAKAQPDGRVIASARLLPTTGPHLMSDLFAAACQDTPPRGPTVWELSQFRTTPDLHGRGPRLGLLWEIICGVMEAALLYGVDQVIFVTNRALLPLTLNCGWDSRTLGPGLHDGEEEATAVAVRITPGGLATIRRRHGVPAPISRLLANTPPSGPGPFSCKSLAETAAGLPAPGSWVGHFCYDWP